MREGISSGREFGARSVRDFGSLGKVEAPPKGHIASNPGAGADLDVFSGEGQSRGENLGVGPIGSGFPFPCRNS